MQPSRPSPDAIPPPKRRWRTALIVAAALGFLVLAGALHIAGVLPPGG